ncbi:hypothetical protein KR222_005172 [Zaprionus bogoriensis]|nr:hypothetical protein KR222_005172 [Zaprionus bogoriensis]
MLSSGSGSKSGSLSSLDALPKQFVLSMKKLFDILDDKQSGYVRFADIEKGWQDDGSKGLPQGVLDSLRRVTPPSGLLSFERFCAGLKLCLLRNQQQQQQQQQTPLGAKPARPPSAPQLLGLGLGLDANSIAPTAKVRPRSQLTLSTPPSLSPELEPDEEYATPAPPPKPPRQLAATAAPLAKADIRNALQNWQLSLMHGERAAEAAAVAASAKQKSLKTARELFEHRGSADGGSSSTSATDYALGGGLSLALPPKKLSGKRRESRRHTLQHGIDYNMLKRLKHLEEQRELLLFGLDGVEKARDFYMQQVLNVQEQIKYFGRLGTRYVSATSCKHFDYANSKFSAGSVVGAAAGASELSARTRPGGKSQLGHSNRHLGARRLSAAHQSGAAAQAAAALQLQGGRAAGALRSAAAAATAPRAVPHASRRAHAQSVGLCAQPAVAGEPILCRPGRCGCGLLSARWRGI